MLLNDFSSSRINSAANPVRPSLLDVLLVDADRILPTWLCSSSTASSADPLEIVDKVDTTMSGFVVPPADNSRDSDANSGAAMGDE